MTTFLGVKHWGSIFDPNTPVVEIVLRGSIIYLTLFVVLRILVPAWSTPNARGVVGLP